ncbi:cytochrome c oxidase subunit II [Aureimonas fodinaquatilis]|uniref:Cytochrome aa3 subunit 2 n=1 Tax=Aureimonas fodinaquatilis TaxID=2565783 RepID=A0A5B0DW08_9HYPH|nr:cytochrome c oxidase subunit II [Aureimonas fodinaquatilis]KAA0970613.1 cytochrome c oxidase subunit II [Aureimonas fodinaquatilis]
MAGCSGNLSTLDPAGPGASAIATLWWVMLAGSAVIFLATTAVLVLAWRSPGMARGHQTRLIAWAGVVLPSIVLTALVFFAFLTGERLMAGQGSEPPLRIEARSSQWVWTFHYPDMPDATTIDVLHMPVGRDVEFSVTSDDVIHSFWVPRLGGKIDAIPGHENSVLLRADKAGTYGGVCAEFCGVGHEAMRFTVIAHPAEEFEAQLMQLTAGGAQ